MRRVLLTLVVLLCATLVAPASALGVNSNIKLFPKAPVSVAVGAPIQAKLNFRKQFSSVTLVCISFQFEGDLLDPGETLLVDFGVGFAGGFTNIGSTPLSELTTCNAQPENLATLLDGRQDLVIFMDPGSVTIASVTATIVGS